MGRAGTCALALAALLAGCGGGGSGDDAAKDIRGVMVKALTSQDPQVRCVDTVTTGFVRTVYHSLAACKAAIAKPDPTKPATDATITGLKVDGDHASAEVTTIGGTSNGSHGDVGFAKEDGSWKIDELSVGFLRSRLVLQVGANRDGPFASAGVRSCFLDAMSRLDDATFRAVAYDAIADRPPNPRFLSILSECSTSVRGSDGVSVLRQQFEAGIRQSAAKDGMASKTVECVLRALRRSIADSDIVRLSSERAQLTERVRRAMVGCGAAG